ncbi:MAG TPA: hypothetical protein ENH62_05780 [Marinobacter sp.]|uniref:Uncharacterized protein n=1 Tax=marine sediment metagenome TaxID=412755 RepID=A0A0F9WD19_9ZZZZ|nr:hypothetical protein [Marinobacter sp.]
MSRLLTRRQLLMGAASVLAVSTAASTITRVKQAEKIAALVPVTGLMDDDRIIIDDSPRYRRITREELRTRSSLYTSNPRHRIVRPAPGQHHAY